MNQFQPNPTFPTVEAIKLWIAVNIPGATIVRTWTVEGGQIACIVDAPEINKRKKK